MQYNKYKYKYKYMTTQIVPTRTPDYNEAELFTKYKATYWRASVNMASQMGTFCSVIYAIYIFRHSWGSYMLCPLLTFSLYKIFICFHDCVHNSYSPNKTLNWVISNITGALMLTSPNWILGHHTHHLTNGQIDNPYHYKFNETVFITLNKYLAANKVAQQVFHIIYHPLFYFVFFPNMHFFVMQRFHSILQKYRRPEKIKESMRQIVETQLLNNVLIGVLFYGLYSYGILAQYVISLTAGFSIGFFTFFNQHTFNPAYVETSENWTFKNSGLLGSSFIQVPRLLSFFTDGIEYHHIHHINSKIPGYNLHKYHDEVVATSTAFDNITKLSLTDCFNNIWLMMYDEERKKYITMTEAYAIANVKESQKSE